MLPADTVYEAKTVYVDFHKDKELIYLTSVITQKIQNITKMEMT